MITRRSSRLVLGALLAGTIVAGPAVAQAHGAELFNQYANSTAHYSISYPANWKPTAARGVDLYVKAPDTNAFLTANAIPGGGTISAAQLKQQQQKVLLGQHVSRSSLSYEVRSINGVAFQIMEGVDTETRSGHKRYLDLIMVDAVHKGYIYDFNAGVLLKLHSSATEITLLQASLNSIKLHS